MSDFKLKDDTKWHVYQHADECVIYADDINWADSTSVEQALEDIKEFIEEEYIAEANVQVWAYKEAETFTVKADLDDPEDVMTSEELKALNEEQKPALGKW